MTIGTVEHYQPKYNFPWHSWPDLANLPKREPLVKRLLDRTAMSVIYGESNCGKTFVALDLAGHVVNGWEWCGRKVRQGRVAYIAAEGGLGIEERLTAFRYHHDVDGTADLMVLPTSVDLCRADASTGPLIEDLMALGPIELVIVDTLSRAMAGGNENSPDDMGAFVHNCDRIRQETGAHVCVIHHAGKDTSKGARGHSALRAATDTEIEVTKDDTSKIVTATVAKQRDHGGGDRFNFQMQTVEIGMDEDEERLTSVALVPTDKPPTRDKSKLTAKQRDALDAFQEVLATSGRPSETGEDVPATRVVSEDAWKRELFARAVLHTDASNPRRDFTRLLRQLKDRRLIGYRNGLLWDAE